MAITASQARARLFPLIEKVNNDAISVEIVSKAGRAYLVPADEYESVLETIYLMRSPANAERLNRAYQRAVEGEVEYHEVDLEAGGE